MKILVKYQNYTMPYTVGYYLHKAFEKLGHSVDREPVQTSYDLSVFVDPVPATKQYGRAFYWEIDSNRKQAREPMGDYDVRFIASKDFDAYPDSVWLPVAADEDMHKRQIAPIVDIANIGKNLANLPYPGYAERCRLLELADEKGYTTYQNDGAWDSYAHELSKGKLILNRPGLKDVNMRFFEAMAIGCMLWFPIGDYTELATPNYHYIPFKNDGEFLDALEKYTKDEYARLTIEKNAVELIWAKHTYKHRALEMLSYL
jgi:hypothetical protein